MLNIVAASLRHVAFWLRNSRQCVTGLTTCSLTTPATALRVRDDDERRFQFVSTCGMPAVRASVERRGTTTTTSRAGCCPSSRPVGVALADTVFTETYLEDVTRVWW